MTVEIGNVLRYLRNQKNMSQEELAQSIVSPSYLSRIENNRTTVEEETLVLLFRRMGLDYHTMQSNEERIEKLLKQWEEPLLRNDKETCRRLHRKLQAAIDPVTDPRLQAEYHIKRIRACILLDRLEDVDASVSFIADSQTSLSPRNRFFYYKHLGNYYWVTHRTETAKDLLEKGVSEYSPVHVSELEKADLFFLYSLSLFAGRNETKSYSYAQMALMIYQNNYKYKECLKAHIHLGICYSNLGDVPSALVHFEKAKALAEEIDDNKHLGVIHHNIATMHLRKKERTEAILALEQALTYKEAPTISYMKSMVLLVFVHYQQGHNQICSDLLTGYRHVVNQFPPDTIHTEEYWFFHHLLHESEQAWEDFVRKTFLPRLEKNRKLQELGRYSRFLGEYYEGKGGYKKAATYYKLALDGSQVGIY